jgi:hypothetical protein
MKRAWVTTTEWNGHTVGTIERISIVEDLPINAPIGCITIVDYDEVNIMEGCEKAVLVDDQWNIIEDENKKNEILKKEAIDREILKMDYGKRVLAYIGVRLNSFSIEDYQALLSDQTLITIQTLLGQGALESSHYILSGYTPTQLLSEQLIFDILAEIQTYIDEVNN